MSDIALPEGIVATEDGLVADDPAMMDVVSFLAAPSKSSRSSDVKYRAKELGYVVKDAMDINSYGKSVFEMITKEGSSRYFATVLVGGKTLLKLIGAIEGDDEGEKVSNADLQNDIDELHNLLQGMSNRLDQGVKQIYQNRLTPFDNAVGALHVECAKVEQMYRDGYQLALERGLIDPDGPVEPEPEKMPEEPAPAELPPKPEQSALPEEPVLDLPAEPISWYELVQKSYNAQEADNKWWPMLDEWANLYGVDQMDYVNDFETRQNQYAEAHAAWEEACVPIRADYEKAKADWEAECAVIMADYDKEVEKWQAECDRINAEHDQVIADWKAECEATEKRNEQAKADYEIALKEWQDNAGDLSKVMVTLCRDEDAAGNSKFRDYNALMNDIRQNFILVAVECAKPEASSPFYAYDSYWDLYFNWHTEGYYLRQAYRSNAEYQLKRAYTLLGVHYDLAKELETDAEEPYTTQLHDALNGIDAIPAGTDPETIDGTGSFEVLCNVNGKVATKGQGGGAEEFSYATDGQINEYVKRLHGNSVLDDLRLAGIYNPSMEEWWTDAEGRDWFPPCGIAFRAERGSDKAHARILTWDGNVVTKATANKADDHWSIYTNWDPDGVGTYWWFTFK